MAGTAVLLRVPDRELSGVLRECPSYVDTMGGVSKASQQLMGTLVSSDYDAALSLIKEDPSLATKPLDYSGRMAFHFLHSDIDVLQRFLALNVDPNQRDGDGRTAAHL